MTHKEKEIQNDTNFNSPSGARGSSLVEGELGVSNKSSMFYGALPIHFELAKKLRDNQTEAEMFLWDHLEKIQHSGIRFKRQHPILYFIADFYCHRAKLVIEVDGGYHDIPEQYCYDKDREHELNELGLKVIRFTNEQVMCDMENTLKAIEQEITTRISSNH